VSLKNHSSANAPTARLVTDSEREANWIADLLLHEYDQLSAYENLNALASFRLLPIGFTISAGVVAYASDKPLIVIGIPYGLFLFGIWLGFIHAMVNGIGLQLVRLEQKINALLNVGHQRGLAFFSEYIANGRDTLPGFGSYLLPLGLFVVTVLIISFVKSWRVLTLLGWGVWWKVLAIIFPLVLNLSVLFIMYRAEKETKTKKIELIREYQKDEKPQLT
jgi:hypothetical protein